MRAHRRTAIFANHSIVVRDSAGLRGRSRTSEASVGMLWLRPLESASTPTSKINRMVADGADQSDERSAVQQFKKTVNAVI
jgi:hypothetical protein